MKDARLDIKTTKAAKTILEQAAHTLGTTVSAFLIEAAMTKAREIIAQSQMINLNREEAEQFFTALQKPAKPSEKLKQLFKKHGAKQTSR